MNTLTDFYKASSAKKIIPVPIAMIWGAMPGALIGAGSGAIANDKDPVHGALRGAAGGAVITAIPTGYFAHKANKAFAKFPAALRKVMQSRIEHRDG